MAKAPVTCQMSITSFKPPQSCVWLVPQDCSLHSFYHIHFAEGGFCCQFRILTVEKNIEEICNEDQHSPWTHLVFYLVSTEFHKIDRDSN